MNSNPLSPRPLEPDHLSLVVPKALERQRLKGSVNILSEEIGQRHRMVIGASSQMKEVAEAAKKAAASHSTVLLLGESGTGKEVFARNIHRWSERRDKPFVAINCVGWSRELLESELFGHEQGAFTGAHQRKKGKLEVAHGGTVFFDEIGDVSPELQAKILRFLQEREFERVGGLVPITVDVRVIAATNRNLTQAMEQGLFRKDLYHRINVIPIRLPSLREKKEDIPVLSRYFLQKYARESGKKVSAIADEAMNKLVSYDWPGNVRELANTIERAVVFSSDVVVRSKDLSIGSDAAARSAANERLSYREGINVARKELVQKALAQAQGNRAAAARVLGLEAKYFLKLMKMFRIE